MKKVKTKEKKHNGIISLWKFIFCIVIAIFHSKALFPDRTVPIFNSGYIGVEFFFLVSGFYFAKHVLKEKYDKNTIGEETTGFILKKFKHFLPYIIIVVSATALIYLKYYKPFNINKLVNSIWNILLLRQFGFNGPLVIGALWYLPVMLMSMFISYPLVKKYGKNYILIVSPLIAIFGLGYLFKTYGTLDQFHKVWTGLVFTGTIRGFAEINIGMIMYLVKEKLQNIQYTTFAKIILTIMSHGLLLFILLLISMKNTYLRYDYVLLIMIIIAIQIMVSEKTYDFKLLSNKYTSYLEKISMPIFINHQLFISAFEYVPSLNTLSTSLKVAIYISSFLIFSIIEYELIEFLKKKKCYNISKLFIRGRSEGNV